MSIADNAEYQSKIEQLIRLNVHLARSMACDELTLLIDAQMERDRKDAARYRFLRNGASNNRVPHITQYPAQDFDKPRMPQIRDVGLDAAIDAAIDAELTKNKKEIDAG